MLTIDPASQSVYGNQQRFNVLSTAYELMGYRDANLYLQQPQPQPAPEVLAIQQQLQQAMQMIGALQQQLADKAKALEIDAFNAQTNRLKVTTDTAHKTETLELDAVTAADKQALDEQQFRFQQQVTAAELALEAQQRRNVSVQGVNRESI
jgi:ABC-type phosphate transport system auxiliary subunit